LRRRVGGVVLAAGSSTRLGRPKQLLSIDGRPLVRHVLAQLQAAELTRHAVVVGCHAEQVSNLLAADSCDILDNPAWAEGIAASIRVATSWARAHQLDALLIAACDQPRLTTAHVRGLLDAHASRGATVASGYECTRGVPAIFSAQWYGRLETLAGDRGAGALLRRDSDVVVLDWPDGMIDVDTLEDAERSGLL
jgi:CTP:molybdopterin cytidylyltransferase MocA